MFEDIGAGVASAFKAVDALNKHVTSGTFTVNQHNVLAAARIIDSQADDLRDKWRSARHDLMIEPPGTDDVSTRMAQAWNDRLSLDEDSYANRVAQYIKSLKKLAVQLGDTAKQYGYTEEQIEAAFKGK